jgi:mannosyltransferase OCH1-like enzyme
MIQKKIYYCWFWKNKKSKLIGKCIKSWKIFCPDFDIVEINEENFDVNQNDFCKKAYEDKKWAFVADYARIKVLYENWW